MKIKKLNDRMYLQDITVVYGCSSDDLVQYLCKKHKAKINLDNKDSNGTYFRVFDSNYIWLESFDWSIGDQGILHHEIFHCTSYILRNLGMDLSNDSDEAFAYYHQMLTMETLNALKETHK